MNKLKAAYEKIGTRFYTMCVVLVICFSVITNTLISNGTTELNDFIQAISIQIQDGNDDLKNYLVRQEDVHSILKKVDVTLNEFDIIDKPLDYIVNKNDLLTITRISHEELVETTDIAFKTITEYSGLHLFSSSVTQEGNNGLLESTYNVSYYNGEENSRELIASSILQEATNKIVTYGKVQSGAYFSGRLTYYGGDCVGCSGISSSGITLSPTTGVNGTNSAQLLYNGKYYYALAADSSIPFGTIIEFSNHNLSISSVAYGIVVDRGGAITGNKIDIFIGSQTGGTKYFTGGTSYNTQFKIISVGSGRNFWK